MRQNNPNRRLPPPQRTHPNNLSIVPVNTLIQSAAKRKKKSFFLQITALFLATLVSVLAAHTLWFQPDLPYIDLPPSAIASAPEAPSSLSDLFSDVRSPGTLALCAAEGNCILSIKNQKLRIQFSDEYYGHRDPGNGIYNRGFCSDQSRGGVVKGESLEKTIRRAEKGCLERTRSRLERATQKMLEAGLAIAEKTKIVGIHFLDLWNQASPRVSDNFPRTYKQALAKGKTGDNAILWARVEAFRRSSGELEAGQLYPRPVGLFKVCVEQPAFISALSGYKVMSENWRWNCIAKDQGRRVEAISESLSVIEQLKRIGAK